MYLGAKRGLFVKIALHKITIFSGCDFTPAKNIIISITVAILCAENNEHVYQELMLKAV